MSYDFALEKPCPHEVLFETGTLDSVTGDVIRFQRPPANQAITLYVNGVSVPPTGLYSFAELPFSQPEPYRILAGQSDLIYVSVGSDIPRLVSLITGHTVKAKDLARDLEVKIPELSIFVENKHVVFSTTEPVNGKAFTFHDPRWTDKTSSLPTTARVLGAYKALGIVPGRVASGRKLFPAWSLVKDPTSSLDASRMIQLESPLLNRTPIIQLNYVTAPQDCRRCFGIRIEFDYSILNNTYETIVDADLLAQEVDKFLFTRLGSHWKWPWLGSKLLDRIGGKGSTAAGNINALLTMDIAQAFATYQNIKNQQDSRFPFQQVSDAEYPRNIDNILVQSPVDDPTVAIITADVITRSLVPVELKRIVGTPNPFLVLGSNPQQTIRFASQPGLLLRG